MNNRFKLEAYLMVGMPIVTLLVGLLGGVIVVNCSSSTDHGAGAKNTARLLDRARNTGKPQGQWLNNEKAAEVLSTIKVDGSTTIRIPQGLGQVIKPDGTIVTTEWATVVTGSGGFRTAYPVLGP